MTTNVSWEEFDKSYDRFKREFEFASKCKEISSTLCRKDKSRSRYVSCWIYGLICLVEADVKYDFVSNETRCSAKDSKECKAWRTKIKMIAKLSM